MINYSKKKQVRDTEEPDVGGRILEPSSLEKDGMSCYLFSEGDAAAKYDKAINDISIRAFIKNMDDTIEHIQSKTDANDSLKGVVFCAFQEIEIGLQRLKRIANGNPAPPMEVIYHFLCDIQKTLPFLDPDSYKGDINKELELLLISENNQLIRTYLKEQAERLQERIDIQNNIDWVKKNGTRKINIDTPVGAYQGELLSYFMEGLISHCKVSMSDPLTFKDKHIHSMSESDAIKRYKIAILKNKDYSHAPSGLSDKDLLLLLSREIEALISANDLGCDSDIKWFQPLYGVGEKTSSVLEHLTCTHYPHTASAYSIKMLSLMKNSIIENVDNRIDHELIRNWIRFKKKIDDTLKDK